MACSAFLYIISITPADGPVFAIISSTVGAVSRFGIGIIETCSSTAPSIVANSSFLNIDATTARSSPIFTIIRPAVSCSSVFGCDVIKAGIITTTPIMTGSAFLNIISIAAIYIPCITTIITAIFSYVICSVSAGIIPISVVVIALGRSDDIAGAIDYTLSRMADHIITGSGSPHLISGTTALTAASINPISTI